MLFKNALKNIHNIIVPASTLFFSARIVLQVRAIQSLKGECALVWFHLSTVRGAVACQPAAFVHFIQNSKIRRDETLNIEHGGVITTVSTENGCI